MPSERKVIAFRPDEDEDRIVAALAKKHGLPMTRVIGLALRQMAEKENVLKSPTQEEESHR